jgi:dephospho-CoA kinase
MKRSSRYPFLRVGVTGGIGSGKSTVCELFAGLGRFVISADRIAKDIANDDPKARRAIELEFGAASYLPDGTLDRKKMAAVVFSDETKRAALNSIIHPLVFKEIDRRLDGLPQGQGSPYVLIEAALIYESGMDAALDVVVVVTAEESSRVARISARDNVPREEIRKRIAAQLPNEAKVKKADFVIHNDGTETELRSTVQFIDSLLTRITIRGAS